MNHDNLAPVTPIPLAPRGAPNHACSRCGSEWWDSVITLDQRDRNPSGYSLDSTRCHDCGLPLDIIS